MNIVWETGSGLTPFYVPFRGESRNISNFFCLNTLYESKNSPLRGKSRQRRFLSFFAPLDSKQVVGGIFTRPWSMHCFTSREKERSLFSALRHCICASVTWISYVAPIQKCHILCSNIHMWATQTYTQHLFQNIVGISTPIWLLSIIYSDMKTHTSWLSSLAHGHYIPAYAQFLQPWNHYDKSTIGFRDCLTCLFLSFSIGRTDFSVRLSLEPISLTIRAYIASHLKSAAKRAMATAFHSTIFLCLQAYTCCSLFPDNRTTRRGRLCFQDWKSQRSNGNTHIEDRIGYYWTFQTLWISS